MFEVFCLYPYCYKNICFFFSKKLQLFIFRNVSKLKVLKNKQTYVLGAIKDFEFKTHQYNDLMQQEPEKVPLLFGRDKVLAENKKLLKEQQAAIKPKLQIKINRSNVPDYAKVFMTAIQEHKDKLSVLSENQDIKTKSISDKNSLYTIKNKRNHRRHF